MRITRISNACVLLSSEGGHVLTDPWFTRHWAFHEPIGLLPAELPRLSAIVGSHSVMDHWDVTALDGYAFKASTPVFVATGMMERKARRAGFSVVEKLEWGRSLRVDAALAIETVTAQVVTGMRVNNYVLTLDGTRVFFGGEMRELDPLRDYARTAPPVDIALLPANGIRLLGLPLVATAQQSLEGARILGAEFFVPIHDAQRSYKPLMWAQSSVADLAVTTENKPHVVQLRPGEPWTYPAG